MLPLAVLFLGLGDNVRQAHGFAMAPAAVPPSFHPTATALKFRVEAATPTTMDEKKAVGAPASAPTPRIRKERVAELIRDVDTPEELTALLRHEGDGDGNEQKPVVVFTYASWCKRCQRVGLQLQKVARKLGGPDGPVTFASFECNVDTQDFVAETQGIVGLPNLRVYTDGDGKAVDAGSSVRDLSQELANILISHRDRGSNAAAASTTVHEELQLSLGVATL